jgi:hypothetical protein
MTVMVSIGNPESAHMNLKLPSLLEARAQIVRLIAAHSRPDRYAALLSRCRTSAARRLTFDLHSAIADWEMKSGKRVRKRRSRRGVVYVDAIERFVGDLLRARADNSATGRIYRPLGKTRAHSVGFESGGFS